MLNVNAILTVELGPCIVIVYDDMINQVCRLNGSPIRTPNAANSEFSEFIGYLVITRTSLHGPEYK